MDVYEALYTTRSMRRVRSDPIPESTQAQILDAAIRAPTGGNVQNWRFLLVDSETVRAEIAPVYRRCLQLIWDGYYAERIALLEQRAEDDPERVQFERVRRSAQWLADNFEIYPLLMFAFVQHDPTGGSIFPAVWNAMLAARAEGVGSTITAALIFENDRVLEILGVPADSGWVMACCVTFGYPTGRWGVAARRPAHEVSYRNRWGEPVGLEIPEPLWSPD